MAEPATASRMGSSADEKIALIRRLFRGRDDVYARRWESPKTSKSGYQPACRSEWVNGLCDKRRVKCADCPNREFLPLTKAVVRNHVAGHERNSSDSSHSFVIGIDPMLSDETCWSLAADFDKATWQERFGGVYGNDIIPNAGALVMSKRTEIIWAIS